MSVIGVTGARCRACGTRSSSAGCSPCSASSRAGSRHATGEQAPRAIRACATRRNIQPRNRANRWQSLTTKPERRNVGEVAVRQFRCRVTINGKCQIVWRHTLTIINDANETTPTFLQSNLNALCASIQCVFDKLFDGGSWTFHHLARRNAVNQNRIEATDGHGGESLWKDNPSLSCLPLAVIARSASDEAIQSKNWIASLRSQ